MFKHFPNIKISFRIIDNSREQYYQLDTSNKSKYFVLKRTSEPIKGPDKSGEAVLMVGFASPLIVLNKFIAKQIVLNKLISGGWFTVRLCLCPNLCRTEADPPQLRTELRKFVRDRC